MAVNTTEHWDTVYRTRSSDELSWFQAQPATSLRLLTSALPAMGSVIDVGAGASTLVDALLDAGWSDVTVLDVSREALALDHDRLGIKAVTFIVVDVLSWIPERTYDAWHDRAVFHFLVQAEQREQYVAQVLRAVRPGGILVLATFAADGPTQCSGLPTTRYDADALAAVFAPHFTLEHSEREEHVTPSGAVQPFTWVVLRRAGG